MLFISRQKQIEELIERYCQVVQACVERFVPAIQEYCQDGDRAKLRQNYNQVHHEESQADDIRREIEVVMYSKALFPESRGDILSLLESLDKVPNQMEMAVILLYSHHIEIPAELDEGLLELAELCRRCVNTLLDAVRNLFRDFMQAAQDLGKVDQLESRSDQVQFALYERIFSSDWDGTQKLLLRDFVQVVALVCDRAENAGDRIQIIVAKRRV